MAEVIRMPKLSDTMTEGVLAEWHVNVGENVKSGDLLAEIESDKATMEFESYFDGVLLHIGVEKGAKAPVDSILAIIGEKGEDISTLLKDESQGEQTKQPEPQAAAQEPSTETSEAIPPSVVETPAQKIPQPIVNSASSASDTRLKASPLAKKLAEEKGIDIQTVHGSGEGGRIVKRDIDNYAPQVAKGSQMALNLSGNEAYTEEPVSQMRATIARRLAESKFSAPHFYLTMDIDMDGAMEARKEINQSGENKISFNDLVIKACAMALTKHPKVNASWLGDKIRYNEHVHIGVAVAVPEGLLVPVVRFANSKGLAQIGAEVKEFAAKARDKKLQPSDWEGNTFTISNLGMYGIEEFTAIINPPDACILAVGGIKQVPVVKNGQIVPGNVMKVTLSCDHRVVDGATGSEFLLTLKSYLENPVKMLV